MENKQRFLLVVAVAYVLWPFDLMPGVPLDDIIISALCAIANKDLLLGR